ncbi:ATP-binding domain-containing protein [Dapis sp. BLCC M126]|uniref:ATP-binding domain-containing protein n=1 Tax=Dapis sp. BLCC M126 TaxID=3400189 RepID=UPI003CF76A4E
MMNQSDIPTYWVSKDKKSKAKYNLNLKGVRIITCESSLGLEFKAVLLIWLEQFDDSIGKNKTDAEILVRRKIYVGMTRAQEYLHLFSNDGKRIFFLQKDLPYSLRKEKLKVYFNLEKTWDRKHQKQSFKAVNFSSS